MMYKKVFLNIKVLFMYYLILEWILGSNITHDIGKCICLGLAVPLPPHKLIEVASQLSGMASLHSLELSLYSVPVRLHVLGMSPSD